MESWRKFVNEATSEKTSQNFNKLATAFGAISKSMSADADKAVENEKEMEKFQKLADNFEKAGLQDFLEKIPDVDKLVASIDDPEGQAEFIKGLQDMDLSPEEISEKLNQIQILRDEFEELKAAQEQNAENDEETRRDIENTQKDIDRKNTESEIASKPEEL